LVFSLLAGAAWSGTASAQTAPTVSQCDPSSSFPTGAGYQVTCTFTIDNTISAQGADSATVTAKACLAAAGKLPPSGCHTTTTAYPTQLVTSIDQCNGIVYGGGSFVTCDVNVTNNVPTGTPTSGVTVNQCNNDGPQATMCTPVGSTTNATVTQCNYSSYGGTNVAPVTCTVTGAVTAVPLAINQCNGSAYGGGSSVNCSTTVSNNFQTSTTTTTTTTASTTTTVPATTTTTTPTSSTTTPTSSTTTVASLVGGGGSGSGTSGGGGSGSGTSGGGGTLPYTGLPVLQLVGAALVMLAVGLGLVIVGGPRYRPLHSKGRA
jgi:hypothetical protein